MEASQSWIESKININPCQAFVKTYVNPEKPLRIPLCFSSFFLYLVISNFSLETCSGGVPGVGEESQGL